MLQVGVVRKRDIIQSVKTSVGLAGGLKIKKNSTVLIRPNANTADYPPGSTNPEVLKHLGLYQAAESNLVHKPDFYISDATKCFVTDGPNIGTIREPGIVIATSDVIANDVVGLALLKTLGTIVKIQNRSVWEQPQIKRAVELGLGVKSRTDIQINCDGVKEIMNITGNILS